jgi:HPt (histidine-containing phosphotransfer) domain-containing protein
MIQFLVQAAWRSRWLLLIPVLIALPVGFAASKLMPLNYVSHSLMLLQESGDPRPLSREPTNVQFITNEERLAALRALLLSDYVLLGVVEDLGITDPKARADKIRELRNTVWLDGAGTNFLQIYHSGPNPVGLGKELETVMVRFLEALVPERGGPSATQVLLEKHERDLAAQRALKADREKSLAELSFGDPAAARARLTELALRLEAANERFRQADHAVQQLAGNAGMAGVETVEQLEEEIQRLGGRNGAASALDNEVPAQDFGELHQALVMRKSAALEQAEAAAAVEAEQRRISSYERLKTDIAEADRKIATAQSQLESAKRRLDSVQLMQVVGVLRAPELIRIIDPPRDPEFPTRSPMIYFLAALAASALLGLGLAVVSQFLDTRLRDPDDFSEVTGAPVIARVGARARGPARWLT